MHYRATALTPQLDRARVVNGPRLHSNRPEAMGCAGRSLDSTGQ
jgi:hypothetical protein